MRLVREPWLGTEVLCYPDRVPTLVHALDRAVRLHPDRVAVEDGGLRVTYRELAELVEAAAQTLADRGLRPGDRLAYALPNGLDAIVAIWACARAGLVVVGLSTRLAPAQWAYMLEHSGASLAIAAPIHLDALATAAARAGLDPDRVLPVHRVLDGRTAPWRGDGPFPDQDAVYGIIYTSGTTGRPKASQLAHRSAMHSAQAYLEILNLTAEDRTALVFPLYYITAHIAQVTPMMLVGGTSVPVAEFAPRTFLELVRDRRITYLMVVPNVWQLLLRLERFGWPDLAHVEIGAFGGSPVPLSTIAALRDRMPQLRLYDAYGLTETHSPATCLLDAEFRRKPGSVGRALPCAELRVVDEDGVDVTPGEPGELLIRGPMVTPGYFGDEAATRAAIVDGWLRTGDVARIDDEGFVFLLDRAKDMIIRGGNKVYSVELEYLLVSHPAISEAAVVGIPDPTAFEAVGAYVVLADDATLSTADVQRWVRDHMSAYAVPRMVRFVDEVPRNRTGKVDKVALREELVAGARAASD